MGINIIQAAKAMGVSRKTLWEILNKKGGIMPEMALRLSLALGNSPESWKGHQVTYDLWRAKQKKDKLNLNNPEEAIGYFETAIELNKMKEINDQKGIAISHTGLGDAYDRLNQPRKAEKMYKVNLGISEKSGDRQGICVMNSKLGAIKIKEASSSKGKARNNLLEEAEKLYEKSLATAEDQSNPVNICFALSGMIETIIVSEAYGQADYVCTKLEEIASKLDLSNAPDFAKNSLKDSLGRLAAESPAHENRIREHCESLSK